MAEPKTLFDDKLIIANCSGFFGDRFSAAREMVEGGPIDILSGDYLAELTMAILVRQTMKDPTKGYAHTFLKQMEQIMGQCLDKNIRVVSNAGGLNPKGLADELQRVAGELGLHPKIAYIEGDNILPRIAELQEQGENFAHLDKGVHLKDAGAMPITANAYFGGWGVVEALTQGADIVVGGRLADAAVVMGPAAWKFGWKRDDWDKLAGAAVAGHIIECSGQATGGNYSFIDEVPSYDNVGFPIAEMHEDGSFVITKHPNTGGLVSVGTVTAQLLYEVREPRYLTPDVGARFDTIRIKQQGQDRVEVSGVCGEPPPDTTKVCINNLDGHTNSFTVLLTGLDIEKKAKILENALFNSIGGKEQFRKAEVQLIRTDRENPASNEEAFAYLRLSVLDPDPKKVALFSAKLVELALCNIPGFTGTAPPAKGRPVIQHWPTLVSRDKVVQKLFFDGKEMEIEPAPMGREFPPVKSLEVSIPPVPSDEKVAAPLGRVFATRSGDKGGNANLGVWGKTPEAYAFLQDFLTVDKLKEILTDMAGYEIERYELPNLLALNFYIIGVLGDGVSASLRMDPQAKTLGEYLRAKTADIPRSLLP
ncbi:acyclic terpene utilization AtuA family protein [Desulfatibacillum aliphaticivorans]|uniref:acyclic terpene utilization AtuA family protein n=1 Tax=Desulfatibacillum aliphaticivorans TaxID=218208 RepID=UPI000488241B|nr:acyclic terpene utilization AtuA family protein [Desulfatibacillum aliphaticivorans]